MPRYLLDQPVILSSKVAQRNLDGTKTPVNPGGATFTILRPDQTTTPYASPTVGTPAVGDVSQTIPATDLTQTGPYQWKLVTTGAGAGTATGSFSVADPFDPELLSLEDAKQALNKSSLIFDDDGELELYIAAVTRLVEKYIGPVNPRTVTNRRLYPRSDGAIQVRTLPPFDSDSALLTVTSLTSSTGTVYTPAAADIEPVNGLIYPPASYGFGYYSGGPFVAVYRVGLSEVPEDIHLAAREVLMHLWRSQRGGAGASGLRAGGGGFEDATLAAEAFAYAKSYGVLDILRPYQQPGIA